MKQMNWYPGHMAKTKRLLKENIGLVDITVEIADARIPKSGVNPDFEKILSGKPRIIAYNKSDLADRTKISKWESYFNKNEILYKFIDSKSGKGINDLLKIVKKTVSPIIQKDLKKGRVFRPIKIMVVGIPNTGKSTFINKVGKRASAKTGNKPGVTKGKQWVKVNKEMQILDTPGILFPKIKDEEQGLHLAYTGAITDELIDMPDTAYFLLKEIMRLYPKAVTSHYKISYNENSNQNILDLVAKSRGCILKGNRYDYERAAKIVLDDFRKGKLGKITLETP